jgi:hypothetical protein
VYKQTIEYVNEFTNADPNTADSMRSYVVVFVVLSGVQLT